MSEPAQLFCPRPESPQAVTYEVQPAEPPMTHRPPLSQSNPNYFFNCGHCRQPVHVEPKQAGSRIDCECGFMNVVPSVVYLQPLEPGRERTPQPPGGSPFRQPVKQQPIGPQPASVPNCPFCSRPMEPGRIIGERYQLKWLNAQTPLTMGIWAMGGIPIGHGGFMQFVRPHVWGWRCHQCAKIIVDERA